ncbi:MAG: AAA family ATPase, partial [Planctomycetota bacterium]
MPESQSIELRIAEALKRDAGRAIARLDPTDMNTLGVAVGDFIRITGARTTLCKAMPAFKEQRGQSRIQLDGVARSNAKAGLDDVIKVERATPQPATSVKLSPQSVSIADRDLDYIGSLLDGVPVTPGDVVRATLFGSRTADFIVQDAQPGPEAIITPTTELLIPRTTNQAKAKPTAANAPSYEDVGGLGHQLARVREMIELPLRFPQVFERL